MPSCLNPTDFRQLKNFVMYRWSHARTRESAAAWWLGLLVMSIGCSKAEISKAIDDAKAKTQSVTESAIAKVEEKLPATGSLRLQFTPPVEIGRAEIEVIVIGDGRPNVVQIANYDTTTGKRQYPAVLLSGTTTVANSRSLAGQSIDCDAYFRQSASSAIAISKPGESVTLVFDSCSEADHTISATLQATELVTSDDQTLRLDGGQITAVALDWGP